MKAILCLGYVFVIAICNVMEDVGMAHSFFFFFHPLSPNITYFHNETNHQAIRSKTFDGQMGLL